MTILDALADRCGIEEEFEDALGDKQSTSPETKRKLLAAMLVDAADDDQARASFERLEHADWSRVAPPVLVAYKNRGSVSVPVVSRAGAGRLKWRVTLENGDFREGETEFQALALVGKRKSKELVAERRTLVLGDDFPLGYHSLMLEGYSQKTTLIVTPGRCWLPEAMQNGRSLWGLAAQLYLLRSVHNWGIGDFTDLQMLVDLARRNGCDVVGLNPLHAMFLDEPENASPYSPADRLLLNVLNIDIEAVPSFNCCTEAQELVQSAEFECKLKAAREVMLVDYKGVAELKLKAFKALFRCFEANGGAENEPDFRVFHAERKELLDRACTFHALREHLTETDPKFSDSGSWPEEYRSFESPGIARFAEQHAGLVRFHLWLQWIADRQLRRASESASTMKIGLYRDLAVGAHPSGAEVWSHPTSLVSGAQVGAPPDIYNPAGQSWGLPPFHPQRLREEGYRSFIDLIRANTRYAGGLRIDHVMALKHLFWIPEGGEPKSGAYVRYPMDDLIGVLALESHRARCLVVGEDLGTVPEGFRERMAEANILSYRVLFFERDEDRFLQPERYPALALSVASSHDLPTLRGWWNSNDIDLKEKLHLYPDENGSMKARESRSRDRADLVRAFREEGLLQGSREPEPEDFSDSAHEFLARSKSLLTLVQIDDITQELEQVNVPSTSSENPNWRRRLSQSLEELANSPRLIHLSEVMSQAAAHAVSAD